MSFRHDPDRERERREVAQEEAMLRRERQDRIEDYTPAPSLPPRVLLKQRHNLERLEMLRRHEAEDKELHEPDCPRTAHGGPCHGPLRFEIAETSLELYERRVDAIEAVLRACVAYEVRVEGFPADGVVALASHLVNGEWSAPDNLRRSDTVRLSASNLRELAEACYSAGELGI